MRMHEPAEYEVTAGNGNSQNLTALLLVCCGAHYQTTYRN